MSFKSRSPGFPHPRWIKRQTQCWFLGGKAGLATELKCLDISAAGIPAVLRDITNVLRYGDVCLLGASDPLLLAVARRG